MPIRRVDQGTEATDAAKFKTAQGLGIASDEEEVLRLLGRPQGTGQWSERHGTIEVLVNGHNYEGLRLHVNRADRKVFAIGATTAGGMQACQQAVLGSRPAAQPAPGQAPAGAPVTVRLPVPMPADLRIIPPGPNIAPDRAAFSGVWTGRWDNTLDTALAVTEITPTLAAVVYGWGVAAYTQAGFRHVRAEISAGELRFSFGSIAVSYKMRPDGKLDGLYRAQLTSGATLTKVFP